MMWSRPVSKALRDCVDAVDSQRHQIAMPAQQPGALGLIAARLPRLTAGASAGGAGIKTNVETR